MNEENARNTIETAAMEEREGAPGPPADGGASAGPLAAIQTPKEEAPESGAPADAAAALDRLTASAARKPSAAGAPARTPVQSDGRRVGPLAAVKKRLKMPDGSDRVTSGDDLSGLRKRILEHKMARLRSIRDRHNENAAELFYLQNGGNMMDYQTWRKRPPTPQLLTFMRTHKLEGTEESEDRSQTSHQAAAQTVPQGAELKISVIGATPVAVSTTLPVAVAQLSQQGSVPGRPTGGRHGMVFAPLRNQSTVATPRLPGGTPLVVDNNSSARASIINLPVSTSQSISTSQEQIVEKAKQEAFVMQRISELQKEGLWSEKRLPKVVEPSRSKAHWDYLLEEMVWLATDFAQERKWKKAAAKKCARMIQKHFQEKELSTQRAEKAQEHQLRRIASFIAKEIRQFWSNVEKLVEFRQQTRLEEKRKQALDQQLSFIVGQTEKYSQQLAEGLRSQNPNSKQNSSIASTSSACQSDGEFRPSDIGSSDDEETIAAAEKEETGDTSQKDEIEALQRESQMDLDEFLNELPQDYLKNRDNIKISVGDSDSESDKKDDDSEFQADDDSTDDEDTIMEQEKVEGPHDYEKEIDELNAENEMSIEELKLKYSGVPDDVEMKEEKIDESEVAPEPKKEKIEPEVKSEESDDDDNDDAGDDITSDDTEEDDEGEGLNALMGEGNEKPSEEHRMEDAAAIAESIQPTGNTLSSTQVVTKVPFLLKHTLREYQHIGLDWLVTMEQRRLNGILADEMGLGKTIQTIALLSHLACEKGEWGPHLIVVPTSVMLNWEMEIKKWCPGFKILTYYGNQKERKLKRVGWTKLNAFHICITSYKLVIQDHQSFRRKKWKYLILDEAQNIKNFKSQRWQLLLNFKTHQRLLLTGTPLQNNLMELWSLMHFLMPDIFASHNEFKEWFSNPVTGMIEGNSEYNENVIKRLHKVLRPFLLRRLKCEVEKQMPKKYEHIVMCRLSKRQRFLYDDFMSRAKTKETLASGNLLSVINILMQLRKVCNHPNLFEVRPTISPFQMEGINYHLPYLVCSATKVDPLNNFDVSTFNLNLLKLEGIGAFESYRVQQLRVPQTCVTNIDRAPSPPPPCPKAALRIHVTLRSVPAITATNSTVPVGTSPRVTSSALSNNWSVKSTSTSGNQIKESQEGKLVHQPISIVQPLTGGILKQLSVARTAPIQYNAADKISDMKIRKQNEFSNPSIANLLKNKRKSLLNFIYDTNELRCDARPVYGIDLREACTIPQVKFCDTLQNDINTFESYLKNLHNILDRFIIYICGAMSPGISIHIGKGAAWRTQDERRCEYELGNAVEPLFKLFHRIKTHMTTQFPDPRLIQYDCGKLQTLDLILRKLKTEHHKVLIFTQMTKMLDVLEAFLNFHGHIYLRLDGTTKVEQRQILMERFNADKRIFAFILSTRSGGVGVNLTGADTVIFYDSDWNPTMDAQAQDRCHRIGQTRDVHIYRLISEKTIEENILKKANQKRMLGDVAIEGGNFTTAYFKSSSIQELFTVSADEDASKRMEVTVAQDTSTAEVNEVSKPDDTEDLETALAQCEDEADVAAAHTARAEADAELAEFDESIPIEEPQPKTDPEQPELSKAEQELEQLMQELSPIERYGIRLVEAGEAATFAEQQAVAEMEKQKRDWEAARRLLNRSPSPPEPESNNDLLLTFSREDSLNQVWISTTSNDMMPVWYPPTPPQGDGDIYVDSSLGYLYDWDIMLESQLPPVYIKRDNKRPRLDAGNSPDNRRPSKSHRREESVYAPRSLFERPSPASIKMRRDMKLQKYRNIVRPPVPIPGIKPTNPRPQNEQSTILGWTLLEDKCLLEAVKSQGLPLSLIVISPAHTPNWDLVADMVNNFSRIYRSPRQCRNRYETEILLREEGISLMDANQKKKKSKSHKSSRSMRTAHLYEQDNNLSFTKDIIAKHDNMKIVFNKKTTVPKRRYEDLNNKNPNPNHMAVLVEWQVSYDSPCNPMEVATKRVERIAKEKQKTATTTVTTLPTEQIVIPSRLQNTVKVPPSPPLGTPTQSSASIVASPRPAQRVLQADASQRPQRIVLGQQPALVKGTAGGKPLNQAQLQYYRQQALVRQHVLQQQRPALGTQQTSIVQQIGVTQQGATTKLTPVTLSSIQVSSPQQRPQLNATAAAVNKQTIARTVTEVEINALIKRQQAFAQQKSAVQQPVSQIFASQQQLQSIQGASGERVAVTIAGTGGVAVAAGTATVAGTATKVAGTGILTGVATGIPGKAPMKMATPQQLRQLQFRQQLAIAQGKAQKVTQLAQVGGGTQVIVQTPGTHKALPPGMTMQQIQQVMRTIPQGGARVVPRQTIQVVGGNVSQVRSAGVTAVSASHQVILSQVSATLQARQPVSSTAATTTTNVRPAIVQQQQNPPEPQPKP